MECYICLEEINNRHPGFGHVAGGVHYKPVSSAQGRDAVIHAIHMECLKGLVATEDAMRPNQCGYCMAVLDIPADSPLVEAFLSPEIQANDRLRRRWIAYFPGLDRPENPRVSRCRTFSVVLGKTIGGLVRCTLLAVCFTVDWVASRLAVGLVVYGTILTVAFVFIHRLKASKVALLVAGGVLLMSLFTVSRRVLYLFKECVLGAIRCVSDAVGRLGNWYHRTRTRAIERSHAVGPTCGSFTERHVFAITNGVTRYVANTRLFQYFV